MVAAAAVTAVMVVEAAATTPPPRIYVRFVIDEPKWRERGWTSVEGAFPTLSRASRGVSRCVGRGQVEEAVADLSINGRLGRSLELLKNPEIVLRAFHTCIYL